MIRIGIAGLGFMGMIHYLAYRKLRGVRVEAMCDSRPERLLGDWRSIKGNFGPQGTKTDLSAVRTYAEIDAMLADPQLDMIDICLPPVLHAPVAIAALGAGKHVFCEKPIALKTADAGRMVAAAQRSGKRLAIGHVLPFFPEYRFAHQAVCSGKYGALISGHFKRIIADPPWLRDFYNPQVTGGPMLDLNIHDTHFIRLLCGMPQAVESCGRMRGAVVETFSTHFDYGASGPLITLTGGVIPQQGRSFTNGFEICLEGATLLFDFAVIADEAICSTPLTVLGEKGKVTRPRLSSGDPLDVFAAELGEATRAATRGETSPLLDGELARDALILAQKQTDSVAKRRKVAV